MAEKGHAPPSGLVLQPQLYSKLEGWSSGSVAATAKVRSWVVVTLLLLPTKLASMAEASTVIVASAELENWALPVTVPEMEKVYAPELSMFGGM